MLVRYVIIFIMIPYLIFPQSVSKIEVKKNSFSVEIDFPKPKYKDYKQGDFVIRDYFEYTDPSKNGKSKLPSKTLIFAIPPNTSPNIIVEDKKDIKLKNIIPTVNPQIISINDSTLAYSESEWIKTDKNNSLYHIEGQFWWRDFYCVAIKVFTHNFNPQERSIQEIEKIKLRFQFDNDVWIDSYSPIKVYSHYDEILKNAIKNQIIAEQFRSNSTKYAATDSVWNWINFNNTYIKFGVVQDGIYRISFDLLNSLGINISNIDPTTFQLFESGTEIPIFVRGENNGTFEQDEYIEFYGQSHYPKISNRIINNDNEEYNEYKDRYTDTSYYFLTWGDKKGKRIFIDDSLYSTQDTIDYYLEVIHKEENNWYQNANNDEIANQTPNWNKNKTWYWKWLGDWNSPLKFEFSADRISNKDNVKVYFKASSAGSNIIVNSHQLALYLNGVKIDSQQVNRFNQVLLNGAVNSDFLEEGVNTITVFNHKNGTSPNYLAVDWFDVEYPRDLWLRNDSLIFKISENNSGLLKLFKISNTSNNNYLIYRISPTQKKITNYYRSGNSIYFTDTLLNKNVYAVFSEEKVFSPSSFSKVKFIDLSNNPNGADYILITNQRFSQIVDQYIDYISSEYHLKTYKTIVNDIFNQFGYGYPTPEAIKLFLQTAFDRWGFPKSSYLEIIGDASYDYKGYVFNNEGIKLSENLVPAYGNPVSDNWYAIWESEYNLPQLLVGRLPIRSAEELTNYIEKLKSYNSSPWDDWNKRYLLFSGGNGDNEYELMQLRSINDSIINKLIRPRPISGNYFHFYKTIYPKSDLGPYSQQEIKSALDNGGIFISYLGHSGTATWDNGINSVKQLENKYNRSPLITDFGCSTNKFAEPDIISFGERFVLDQDGQAIGYVGNSSLGFLSSATSAPLYFYKSIFEDSLHQIGDAHLLCKVQLIENLGPGGTAKIFSYTNSIIGDPVISLKIPNKPNLIITPDDLLVNSNYDESFDSIAVPFVVTNNGASLLDSLNIMLQQTYDGGIIKREIKRIILPEYKDTLLFYFKTKGYPGIHNIELTLDYDNEIDEIYENDNHLSYSLNVYSLALRDVVPYNFTAALNNKLKILNPSNYNENRLSVDLQISERGDFSYYNEQFIESDSFYSYVNLNELQDGKRYWYRYRINKSAEEFSPVKSFIKNSNNNFIINDSISFSVQDCGHLVFNNGIVLSNDSVTISVLSAGAYTGATCVISRNGKNLLSNNFFAGMAIATFNPVTMEVDTAFWLELFQRPDNVQLLADFINSLPSGEIVAMGVSNDARNNMSSTLKDAIRTLGSSKIDSLVFQGPWALIGAKGANPNDIIEMVGGKYDPTIIIDSVFITSSSYGYLLTERIGPAKKWNSLNIRQSTDNNSILKFRLLGIKKDESIDTLNYLAYGDSPINIDTLNATTYPYIRLLTEFIAGDSLYSPKLNELAVQYLAVPELGTNYQVASVDRDTVIQGEDINLSFYVYNVGESTADDFRVIVKLKNDNTSSELIYEEIVDSLVPEKSKYFNVKLNTSNFYGEGELSISIDEEDKILELYEDNNFYAVPFYVQKDTSKPSIEVTFDGETILDGDFVSSNTVIQIALNDPSLIPIADTSSVSISLDNYPIYYSNNNNIDISFQEINPKVLITFHPELKKGRHKLTVFARNANGIMADSSGLIKYFEVDNNLQLLDVYNYPNPFSKETYFTFRLSKLPEQISIKIYTIAGRLIKTIQLSKAELNLNLNKVNWDGKDNDGDPVANGTYLYQVILYNEGKHLTSTNKLAIIH